MLKNKINEEELYLQHLETIFLPFLFALIIFSLTLLSNIKNVYFYSIVIILLAASFYLSLNHIRAIINKNIKSRIVCFFVDGTLLIVITFSIISLIIRWTLFGLSSTFLLSVEEIIYLIVSSIIVVILSLEIMFRLVILKIKRLFPLLCKRYNIYSKKLTTLHLLKLSLGKNQK